MVKKIILTIIVSTFLFADVVIDKAKNFMNSTQYRAKKSLVAILFKNRDNYLLPDGRANSLKIIYTLKSNGLIKLFLSRPKNIDITFSTTTDKTLLFIKVLSDSLNALGYNYFLTKIMKREGSNIDWTILIKTNHLIDPILLAKELRKRDTKIEDITKLSSTHWRYKISTINSKLKGLIIDKDRYVELNRPQDDYFLNIDRVKVIKISAKKYDKWYPYIVFYDKNLMILNSYKSEDKSRNLSLKVPKGSKYIKIGDNYTLENIKRGLTIYLDSY